MKKSISTILAEVDRAPTAEDKIRLLRENHSKTLVEVVQGAFDSRIKWLLPEGPVPYIPNKLVDLEHVLYNRSRELYLFVEGGAPTLSQSRREQLFIQLLESLDKNDAALIATIKDKKLPFKTITPDIVVAAFPTYGIMPWSVTSDVDAELVVSTKPKKRRPRKVKLNVEDTAST